MNQDSSHITSSLNADLSQITIELIADLSAEKLENTIRPLLTTESYHHIFSALSLAAIWHLPPSADLLRQLAVAYRFRSGDHTFLLSLIECFKAEQAEQAQLRLPQLGPSDPPQKSFQQLRGSMYYGDAEAADDAVTKMCRTTSMFQIFEFTFELGIQDLSAYAKKAATTLQYWKLLQIIGFGYCSPLLRALVRYFCQSETGATRTDRHDNRCWIESEILVNKVPNNWTKNFVSSTTDSQFIQIMIENEATIAMSEVSKQLMKGHHPWSVWLAISQIAQSQIRIENKDLRNEDLFLGVSSLFEISQTVASPDLRLKAMLQAVGLVSDKINSQADFSDNLSRSTIDLYNLLQTRVNQETALSQSHNTTEYIPGVTYSRYIRHLRLYEVISAVAFWVQCQTTHD